MPLADELLGHSRALLSGSPAEIDLRRAVSAAYYALFHLHSSAVAEQVSPDLPVGLRGRTQRALDHGSMVKVARQFSQPGPVPEAIPKDVGFSGPVSQTLANVAAAFADLQSARYSADYDVLDADGKIGPQWAVDCVAKAEDAFRDWRTEGTSEGARVFLAALIIGGLWNKGSQEQVPKNRGSRINP